MQVPVELQHQQRHNACVFSMVDTVQKFPLFFIFIYRQELYRKKLEKTPRQARQEKDERQRREKRVVKATVQVDMNTATTKAKHPTAHRASRTTATFGLYLFETLLLK